MQRPDQAAIASVLRDVAAGLELLGDNRYRVQAYRRGANALEQIQGDLDRLIAEGRLVETPGIGESLAALVAEVRATGRARALDDVAAKLPEGAIPIARAAGLRLRAIRTLAETLGVASVDELRAACAAGRVRSLPGFGERTEQKLLETLERGGKRGLEAEAGTRLDEALELGDDVARRLRSAPGVDAAELVGAARRGVEVVDEIDVLATGDGAATALDRFASDTDVTAVLDRDARSVRARLARGAVVRVHAASRAARASALVRLTGSSAHVTELERRAAARGLRLEGDGVFRGEARIDLPDERALYALLDLAFVPPPLREGDGEVERAAAFALEPLVELADVQGLVHCHTRHSDGKNTIEEMARAAEAMGMRYITITDHSPTAHYARGVELDRLARQWDEIARVQEKVAVRILRGTESDILKDGALDYPDRVLEQLDVVIASVHNRYGLGPAEMTARLVAAMRHPLFKIWGHALGRILQKRPPIACDVDEVLGAIAESRAAVELNGDPHRMDLAPSLAKRARALGIRFVLSVDAHATDELANVGLAVRMAQRAGMTRGDVLNTLDADAFARAVRPARA